MSALFFPQRINHDADGVSPDVEDEPVCAPRTGRFAHVGDHAVTVSLNRRSFRPAAPTFKGAVTGVAFDTEIGGHEVSLGLRYGF